MSERNIRLLKKRMMRIAMFSFTIVMFVMGSMIYFGNLAIVRSEVREILNAIADNEGELPAYETFSEIVQSPEDVDSEETEDTESDSSSSLIPEDNEQIEATDGEVVTVTGDSDLQAHINQKAHDTKNEFVSQLEQLFGFQNSYLSGEYMYSTRFFSVIFPEDEEEDVIVKTTYIASVDREQAIAYATRVEKRFWNFGRFGDYYYRVKKLEDHSTIVVIMDCTSQVALTNRVMTLALIIIAFGMALTYCVMRKLSDRFVQKEMYNADLQKQFITNASHELKTPLAVIRANTELTEMMSGKTEWTEATLRQVDRLQGLIQNLVLITRAQENDQSGEWKEINLSKAIKETADTFMPVASQDGKKLEQNIPEDISMIAEEGQMRQLASLLIDNAIKYCDDGGTIGVTLTKTRKLVTLTVSNHYAEGATVDYTKFFDRFYREDSSHNTDKEGYGIGLSIAESIVSSYIGTIDASWKDGVIFFTCRLIDQK